LQCLSCFKGRYLAYLRSSDGPSVAFNVSCNCSGSNN